MVERSRVGRKIWGPGPTPGSSVLRAVPNDILTADEVAALEAGEVDPATGKPVEKPKPAPKRSRKKADD